MSTTPRFLHLADVAEILNISAAQVYALVRSGELPAIKIGGRGQWRVESSELEAYIARMYEQTRDFVTTHRFGRGEADGPESNPAEAQFEADQRVSGSQGQRLRIAPTPETGTTRTPET